MTLIEFFDRADINNIVGALVYEPEKLVFLGKDNKEMRASIEDYKKILNDRKLKTVIVSEKFANYNIFDIFATLERILAEYDDCVFDLQGGDELFLVAVGMLYQKYGDKVQLHRIDAGRNNVIDCDEKVRVVNSIPVELSVDEIVSIYGGRVIRTDEVKDGTYDWDFSEDFVVDLDRMWKIFCEKNKYGTKTNCGVWNYLISVFEQIEEKFCSGLHMEANLEDASLYLSSKNNRKTSIDFKNFLCVKLLEAGLISNYKYDRTEGVFSFDFRNEQVKRVLTSAGRLLEVYTTYLARELEKNDMDFYTDVVTGVYIDWDGKVENPMRETDESDEDFVPDVYNEIDIILMKGVAPIFISCKSGKIDMDELYKLATVSERFGGPYVKKVLLCAGDLDTREAGEYIRARAKEMKIRIIEEVDFINLSEFRKELRMIWDN